MKSSSKVAKRPQSERNILLEYRLFQWRNGEHEVLCEQESYVSVGSKASSWPATAIDSRLVEITIYW